MFFSFYHWKTRSGENCVPNGTSWNYSKYTEEIEVTSLEGQPGMEIAGSRILIISPPETFWTGSCTYNVSFEHASIWPDTTGTPKDLVAFWYNFTYIEVPPALISIIRDDTATTDTRVGHLGDLAPSLHAPVISFLAFF